MSTSAWAWLAAAISVPFFISTSVHVWLGPSDGVLPYLTDYANRAVFLGILLGVPQLRQAYRVPSETREQKDVVLWVSRAGALSFFMVVFERLAANPIGKLLSRDFPNQVLFTYPPYGSDTLRTFDLTIGLLTVAFSEELMWRRALMEMLRKAGWPNGIVVPFSAVAFGLLHWPGGIGSVAYATLLGLLLALFYARYRSLWLVVTIHYLIDLEVFGYFHGR